MTDTSIVDNPTAGRFEHREGEHLAELVYELEGNRLTLVHTGVPDELGGRGLGGRLVRAAIDKARAEGLVIVPQCPFARDWLKGHPDAHDGVTVVTTDG
ncbi:MAG TPA: GNAT family N-acetyltransferase [Acidimicrobiales bacterium]